MFDQVLTLPITAFVKRLVVRQTSHKGSITGNGLYRHVDRSRRIHPSDSFFDLGLGGMVERETAILFLETDCRICWLDSLFSHWVVCFVRDKSRQRSA